MSEFQTVLFALNEGFVATLKLFVVTLVGSIPLGLIICFGSMNRWAPLGALGRRRYARQQALLHLLEDGGSVTVGEGDAARTLGEAEARRMAKRLGFWAKVFSGFRPLSLLSRLVVWVIRGTPLMLQLYIIFYVPGMIMDHNPWSFSEGRFAAASVMFVINYACYFSEIYRGGIQGSGQGTRPRLVTAAHRLVALLPARPLQLPEIYLFHHTSSSSGDSSVKFPSFPLLYSSSSTRDIRSVSTSPPEIRNPRFRPHRSSSSQPGNSGSNSTL